MRTLSIVAAAAGIASLAQPAFAQVTEEPGSPAPAADVQPSPPPSNASSAPPAATPPSAAPSSAPSAIVAPPPTPRALLRLAPEPDDQALVAFGPSADDEQVVYRCSAPCILSIAPGEYTVRFERRRSFWTDTWTDTVSRTIHLDERGLLVRRGNPGWPWVMVALGAAAGMTGAAMVLPAIFLTGTPRDPEWMAVGVGLLVGGLLVEVCGTALRVSHSLDAEIPPAPARRANVQWHVTPVSMSLTF